MEVIKTVGATILGVAILVALIFAATLFIEGTASVAGRVFSILANATAIVTILCILVLLPLSVFRATRIISLWGFFTASYLFGLSVWMLGFLITYDLWGGRGVLIGLLLGGIGIVPLGIIAAALKGMWFVVANLVFGIAITYGARAFSIFLATKIDHAVEEASVAASRAPIV